MIDLRNTCILVKTKEENEMILNEAEKQGFHWVGRSDCKPLQQQHFPDILSLFNDKNMTYVAYINSNSTFHEASELLGEKEMTAREFAEWIADASNCRGRNCSECILDSMNTEGRCDLCNTREWKGNIDKLLEIVKSGRITVPTPEEQAIDMLEKFIKNSDHVAVNEKFVESLKLVLEKLKEKKENENCKN